MSSVESPQVLFIPALPLTPPLRSHVGSHCTSGQKIEVVVTADGTAADKDSSGRAVVAATAGLVVLVAMLF